MKSIFKVLEEKETQQGFMKPLVTCNCFLNFNFVRLVILSAILINGLSAAFRGFHSVLRLSFYQCHCAFYDGSFRLFLLRLIIFKPMKKRNPFPSFPMFQTPETFFLWVSFVPLPLFFSPTPSVILKKKKKKKNKNLTLKDGICKVLLLSYYEPFVISSFFVFSVFGVMICFKSSLRFQLAE